MKEEKCLTYEASQKCQCSFCKEQRIWINQLIIQEIAFGELKRYLDSLKEKKNASM